MLSENKPLPSFYNDCTKTEQTKHYFPVVFLTPFCPLMSLYLFIWLQLCAFSCSPVSDTTFPAGLMTRKHTHSQSLPPSLSLFSHINTELRVRVAVRLVRSPPFVFVWNRCVHHHVPCSLALWPLHELQSCVES